MGTPLDRKLYLKLFHGRNFPSEVLEDWGFDGPIFGPLEWAHTTYSADVKLGYGPDFDFCRLIIYDGLLYYDGKWYGDWTACLLTENEVKDKIVPFDESKTSPN